MRYLPILLLLTACATLPETLPIPPEWQAVPRTALIASVSFGADGRVVQSTEPPVREAHPSIRLADGVFFNGDRALTAEPMEIESFDVSDERGEIAFTARRESGFDPGLVSTDGSPISWLPADPADEVAIEWAPRGNKTSYVIRAYGGDAVRTLHVPTAFQFTVPFPNATIHALAWDPPAERYAVAWSTPEASGTVEVMRYDGTDRRLVVPPAERLDLDLDPFGRQAILLRPRDLPAGEKIPVVIWQAADFRWSDERAALMRRARVACLVTTAPPDAGLLARVSELRWVDPAGFWVVGAAVEGERSIVADPAVEAGRYRQEGRTVRVSPAVVQSFAAGFIPAHVKRTTPTDGSSR